MVAPGWMHRLIGGLSDGIVQTSYRKTTQRSHYLTRYRHNIQLANSQKNRLQGSNEIPLSATRERQLAVS